MAFGGENAESYYDDGLTASMKGDLHRARKCFEKAIHMDSSFVAAYHQVAKCYLRLGHSLRAVEILQQVIKKRPENTTARLDLGYALLAMGRHDAALNQFKQLVALDETSARPVLGLAQVHYGLGDGQTAMAHAEAALHMGDPNFAVLFILGRAAKMADEIAFANTYLEQADTLIEKTLEGNPEGPEGYYLRGEVAVARNQFATALEHYAAALEHADAEKPDRNYSAYGEHFTRIDILAKTGLCYHRLGKTEQARKYGEKVLELDAEHETGKLLCAGDD